MESKFIGRDRQIKILNDFFNASSEFAGLVYGRRRIGKTELLKQSLKMNPEIKSIYYECKETSEENNVESFSDILSESLNMPPLAFKTFESILSFLYRQSRSTKTVLVIDEYPYLRKVVSGLDSIIQNLIDGNKNESMLKIVLCGSYVETMQSLLEKENPLFGRFDVIINLKAMDYYESSLFYKEFSYEDKVRLYSVFGGIPYYNRLIDSKKTVRENIIDLIASPSSRLENEVTMYLKSEISKMQNAYEVFEALAKGIVKFADILAQSKVSSSPTLSDVLDKLIKMDVVEKKSPINDENNRKKSGYYVSDQLTMFYFKYIYRNLSRLNVMNSDLFFDRFIAQDFDESYVPKAFEQICSQFLIRENQKGLLEYGFERIGKYYYDDAKNKKNGEFDIVTECNGSYVFYEAKFRSSPLDKALIWKEIQQVNACGLSCQKYGFFSRKGFKDIDEEYKENLILYELKDLYE